MVILRIVILAGSCVCCTPNAGGISLGLSFLYQQCLQAYPI